MKLRQWPRWKKELLIFVLEFVLLLILSLPFLLNYLSHPMRAPLVSGATAFLLPLLREGGVQAMLWETAGCSLFCWLACAAAALILTGILRRRLPAGGIVPHMALYTLLTLSAPLWLHLFCTMSGIRLSEIILTAAAMAALPLTVLIWGGEQAASFIIRKRMKKHG
ncbi:MAG: hypothetical protein HFJ79_10270 [Clostridiales bacterium]|nr:hypothetical protein [Clostridiales bacterium]